MQEVWKDIPNYEGLYQVSNLGRVFSLPKEWVGSKGCKNSHNGKLLSIYNSTKGYSRVVLINNGKRKTREVHQLVAEAFLGHTPCGFKLVVDHINNNKLNNTVNNLQLISQRENVSKNIINKTSKYTGVNFDKSRNKWQSRILIGGKRKHLGYFDNELDAYNAYIRKLEATN